ncbi:hypothetical protein PACTADRAFT_50260 [Pachysolen tannophilus NRRL Y-2460]|uniref:non-specific serine/threonine protein kinase n=1 Tax=Pachysolen tannophilus NRRL Y-2460 TaxID=669874 RepID=A0A1E4TUZ8_PACTA|nr:hypothetical protein PACTADRAFT_50260 [Pachysolen tannophilus NRRL Y-2460]
MTASSNGGKVHNNNNNNIDDTKLKNKPYNNGLEEYNNHNISEGAMSSHTQKFKLFKNCLKNPFNKNGNNNNNNNNGVLITPPSSKHSKLKDIPNIRTNLVAFSSSSSSSFSSNTTHTNGINDAMLRGCDDDDMAYSSASSSLSSESLNSDGESESKLKELEENEKDYCSGGYHPTFIGEKYGPNDRYTVVRKLGWGHFSTVWLAFDNKTSTHVAFKIVRSAKQYHEAALDEIKILEAINDGDDSHPGKRHLVKMLDHFVIKGPNGQHVCMVFEVLGENMLNLINKFKDFQKNQKLNIKSSGRNNSASSSSYHSNNNNYNNIYNTTPTSSSSASFSCQNGGCAEIEAVLKDMHGGLPIQLVKQITKQLLLALDYLHSKCGLIHTDLKPENVLIEINDVEKLLKLIELDEKKKRRNYISKLNTNYGINRRRNSAQQDQNINSGGRHKSRRSITKYYDSPVRCSKPLSSPLTIEENIFRSFSLASRNSFSSSHRSSVSKDNSFNNNNNSTEVINGNGNGNIIFNSEIFRLTENSSLSQDIGISPREMANSAENLRKNKKSLDEKYSLKDEENSSEALTKLSTSFGSLFLENKNELSKWYQDEYCNSVDLNNAISIKIADLGNACWSYHHYTNDIQTRQYRAPEIILGGEWGCSTDIWSAACLIFELITSDYLFDPKIGASFGKDDDHLAQIMELLDYAPHKDYLSNCKNAKSFFSRSNDSDFCFLKKIRNLKIWKLDKVLLEKYHLDESEADEISDLLVNMLKFEPKDRMDAAGLSNHSFLSNCNVDEGVDKEYGSKGEDIKGWYYEYKASRLCCNKKKKKSEKLLCGRKNHVDAKAPMEKLEPGNGKEVLFGVY